MIGKQKLRILSDSNGYIRYADRGGSFFIYNYRQQGMRNNEAFTCRESFGDYFNRYNSFVGFAIRPDSIFNIKKLNKFWSLIENKLNIRRGKTRFFACKDYKSVVIIKPAKFWLKNDTTRGFFSLFLRCGVVYYKGNLNKSFENYDLASEIIPAIKYFLKGNTKPTYKNLEGDGIVDHFSGIDYTAGLRENLVKP